MPETKNRDTADIVDDAARKKDLASAGFKSLLMMGA